MDGRPNKVAVTEGAALRTKRTGKPKHASSLPSKLTCRRTELLAPYERSIPEPYRRAEQACTTPKAHDS